MPSIKVYPPQQLPDRGVTETQFNIWIEELEVYISQEDDLSMFLPEGRYESWLAAEDNPNRLVAVKEEDIILNPPADPMEPNVRTRNEVAIGTVLKKRIKSLRTVLSLIGKCVAQGHYTAVTKHSTSMMSIYAMLRRDYDIQQRGIHFLNILDLKYDNQKMTPVGFYNQYRTLIANNLAAQTDVIKYKDNHVMREAERMSPMIEDLILLNVIKEIDGRLPNFVKVHYHHKMKDNDRLMDFKTDMLNNIPTFLNDLDNNEQMNMLRGDQGTLQAFQSYNRDGRRGGRQAAPGRQPASGRQEKFCKPCHKAKLPRSVFKSHNIGDPDCQTLSQNDYNQLIKNVKMSSITGQDKSEDESDKEEEIEVNHDPLKELIDSLTYFRSKEPKLSFIKPVPTQLLTVYQDFGCHEPIHMDMDSGATLNYVRLSEAIKYSFKISPNGQLSTLGDGISKLKSVGEIDVTFFRNNWTVRFRALVSEDLQAPFIGGTLFMVDNKVVQDISRGVIHIHDKKFTVPETSHISIAPVSPLFNMAKTSTPLKSDSSSKLKKSNSDLISFKSMKVVLPGQELSVETRYDEDTEVVVEPWAENVNSEWPRPQLSVVKHGNVELVNDTDEPIILTKDVKLIKVSKAVPFRENSGKNFYNIQPPSLMNILHKQGCFAILESARFAGPHLYLISVPKCSYFRSLKYILPHLINVVAAVVKSFRS